MADRNYSARYGNLKKYKKRVHKAHLKTGGRCCCCGINPSEEIHHTNYRKSGDRYGINIFPVCKHCHTRVCHSSENWIKSKTDPVWGNHNTKDFTDLLKLRYKFLYKKTGR